MTKQLTTERGSVSSLVTIIVLALGLVGATAFAIWAFAERTDYKTNVEQKIAAVVTENTKKVQADDAKKFAEEAQKPLKTFIGPETYGSVNLSYPKNWSAHVAVANSSLPVDLYVHPEVVPGISDTSVFALRMQVSAQKYETALRQFSDDLQRGTVTVEPYQLPKNPGIVGSRIDGQLSEKKTGSLVLLPLRDKTLKIWTESTSYSEQFNDYVLANAHFTP